MAYLKVSAATLLVKQYILVKHVSWYCKGVTVKVGWLLNIFTHDTIRKSHCVLLTICC